MAGELIHLTSPRAFGSMRRKFTLEVSDWRVTESTPTEALWDAIEDHDASHAAAALGSGANPNSQLNGVPALVRAALLGRGDIVELLLDAGAEINARNGADNLSALAQLASIGHTDEHADVLRMLLRRGADVGLRDNNGETALDLAVAYHQPVHARLLVMHHAPCKSATREALNRQRASGGTDPSPGL